VLYQLSYTPTRNRHRRFLRRFKHRSKAVCKGEAAGRPLNRNLPKPRLLGQSVERRDAERATMKEETMTVQTAAERHATPQTPALPQAKPESLGLSPQRLQSMSDSFSRQIDNGTLPGITIMVARRGQIGWFEALGRQSPSLPAPMAKNTIFRIFSMTKPVVSVGIMMLLEEGRFLLDDPLAKFIPEFADQKVGVENGGKLELVALQRPITIQDLLRHTSGITYEHTGNSLVQQLYQRSRVRSRKISNAEHAALVAGMPLICQPGSEWNYSRSTDILGRLIEVISGQTLGAFLEERILAPLQMTETAFRAESRNAHRLAEPFPVDPWTGEQVQLFNMLEKPAMESGGGGLVSTTIDYARFCQMLLNGGKLDGVRIIGRKTLELMTADHLGPAVRIQGTLTQPGHSFGLGFGVRTQAGIAPSLGSVGQFFWSGIGGTFFWIDPKEELFAIFMSQAPGQRVHTRTLVRNLVYAALD
jgi:CubicO group peptidase (beta-lactamase class C family)